MTTAKQRKSAADNIKKAQAEWIAMSTTSRARAQPQGRSRIKPGKSGEGDFYRIVLRPKSQFVTFRNQDVGDTGHIERLAGKRPSGSWDTQAWLISKADAHSEDGHLVADTREVQELLDSLGSRPKHERGDIWIAQDKPNIREEDKPTPAQKRARKKNIKKAQAARQI